jgi:hypothetical protein
MHKFQQARRGDAHAPYVLVRRKYMTKQMTQAIVGLLGVYFLISAIANLAGSTHGISYEATLFDKLLIFQQPIILFVVAVLCIKYRDSIATWLNKNASSDEPTDVNMDKLECLAYRILGMFTLMSTSPFFIMSYTTYFIKPMMQAGGANEHALQSYAAVQFIAAIVDLALSLILVIVPGKIQTLLKKTRGY